MIALRHFIVTSLLLFATTGQRITNEILPANELEGVKNMLPVVGLRGSHERDLEKTLKAIIYEHHGCKNGKTRMLYDTKTYSSKEIALFGKTHEKTGISAIKTMPGYKATLYGGSLSSRSGWSMETEIKNKWCNFGNKWNDNVKQIVISAI